MKVEFFKRRDHALNILVVEDEPVNQTVLQVILERLLCGVSIAKDGREALEILNLNEQIFDLIFMDIQMPNMNGIEATKRIRSGETGVLNKTIPIIAYTTLGKKDKEYALEVGMDNFLQKPVRLQVIKDIIGTYCS
jgi:CheY-like chemotaxis protein